MNRYRGNLKLKCILLSKGSQSEKATYYVIPIITFWKSKSMKTIKGGWLPGIGWGRWRNEEAKHRRFLKQ